MVNNKIQEFLNEKFGNVRAITKEDEIWFVAKDICDVLGTKTKDLREILKNKGYVKSKIPCYGKNSGARNEQDMICVSIEGVHRIISASRKKDIDFKRSFFNFLTGKNFEELVTDYCYESDFMKMLDKSIDILKKQSLVSNSECYDCIFGNVPYFELFDYEKQYNVLDYRIDIFFKNCNLIVEYDEKYHKHNQLKDSNRMNDICFELLKNGDNIVELINEDGSVRYINKNEFNHNMHNYRIKVIRVQQGKEYEGIIKILAHITSYYIY